MELFGLMSKISLQSNRQLMMCFTGSLGLQNKIQENLIIVNFKKKV
jgi:hypothetical protein